MCFNRSLLLRICDEEMIKFRAYKLFSTISTKMYTEHSTGKTVNAKLHCNYLRVQSLSYELQGCELVFADSLEQLQSGGLFRQPYPYLSKNTSSLSIFLLVYRCIAGCSWCWARYFAGQQLHQKSQRYAFRDNAFLYER